MRKKIGIVLSGGAVRGLAHIGVLKALEEKGIKPDVVSGASAGAIVGAFYCAGYSPDEMADIVKQINFLSHLRPNVVPKNSLFKIVNLENTLKKYIKEEKIENLNRELFVCVSNLNDGKPEYYNYGEIGKLLRASSSLPILFEPVKIGKNLYVDGGLMDNLPVEPLLDRCDYIIGVEVNPLGKEVNLNNIVSISIRSFYLAVRSNVEARKKYCNVFIQPEGLKDVGLFELWKWKKAIDIGYRFTSNLNIDI